MNAVNTDQQLVGNENAVANIRNFWLYRKHDVSNGACHQRDKYGEYLDSFEGGKSSPLHKCCREPLSGLFFGQNDFGHYESSWMISNANKHFEIVVPGMQCGSSFRNAVINSWKIPDTNVDWSTKLLAKIDRENVVIEYRKSGKTFSDLFYTDENINSFVNLLYTDVFELYEDFGRVENVKCVFKSIYLTQILDTSLHVIISRKCAVEDVQFSYGISFNLNPKEFKDRGLIKDDLKTVSAHNSKVKVSDWGHALSQNAKAFVVSLVMKGNKFRAPCCETQEKNYVVKLGLVECQHCYAPNERVEKVRKERTKVFLFGGVYYGDVYGKDPSKIAPQFTFTE